MSSGALNDDVAFFDKIRGKREKIYVFSAREKKSDDKSFGFERQNSYPPMEKYYYDLFSKQKFNRALEAVWLITNNIPDQKFY
mmetsp:Transcript_21811/g.33744  ORF Transcript_21811/g.33744 Transcript_21811/m.33744 type:complete len:83 (+) Transcript_21811:1248-1496(+)